VAFVLEHTIGGEAAAIWISSPSDYQVFQRSSPKIGAIRLRGNVLGAPGDLAARVVRPASATAAEQVVVDWQPLAVDSASATFDTDLAAPAGGWYRVEMRFATKQPSSSDRPPTAAIEHVGVGEVFVVAGQSNSTNWGSERQSTETGMVSSFDGLRWRLANDPQPGTQDGSQAGSFLPAFGDALYKRLGVPIGVASTGAGGTSVRQWLPAGETMTNLPTVASHVREVRPGVWESTGELFNGLIRRLSALGPQGCRAVLWHQGESDAGQARAGYPADRQISGQQYREFMEKLVAASRKEAKWNVPWFTAQTTYHSPQDPGDEEFRAAQRELWEKGISLEGPDTDSLGPDYRDGNHFNTKGLTAHGRLWADKVAAHLAATAGDAPGNEN
jgi:hypothetical protein